MPGVHLFIPIRWHITVALLWMPHPWGEFALFEWLCVMSCWNHDLLELFSIPQNDGAALVRAQRLPDSARGHFGANLAVAAGCRPMSLSWSWVPWNTIVLASEAQLSLTRLKKGFCGSYLLEPQRKPQNQGLGCIGIVTCCLQMYRMLGANTVTNQSPKGTLHLLSHLSPCWCLASPWRLKPGMAFIPSSSSFPYLQR